MFRDELNQSGKQEEETRSIKAESTSKKRFINNWLFKSQKAVSRKVILLDCADAHANAVCILLRNAMTFEVFPNKICHVLVLFLFYHMVVC